MYILNVFITTFRQRIPHLSQDLFVKQGGEAFYNSEIGNVEELPNSNGYLAHLKNENEMVIHANVIINSTGLYSNTLSKSVGIKSPSYKYSKGHYAGYRPRKSLVSRLIYPVPDPNIKSLGVHCTLDLNGKLKFGPDVEYIDNCTDYSLPQGKDEERLLDGFYTSVSKYLKNLKREDLYLDYCGIRPKLSGPSEPFQDFIIQKHGSGFINLLGIESPGLTSSLAIAEYIEQNYYK